MSVQDDTLARAPHQFGIVYNRVMRDPRVGMAERGFYALLATYADNHRGCFPGVKALAKEAGVSVSTVRRYIDTLVAAGLLSVTPRHAPNGRQTSNTYVLLDTPGGEGVTGDRGEGDISDRGEGVTGEGDKRNRPHEQHHKEQTLSAAASSDTDPAPSLALVVSQGPTPEQWFDLFWQHYPRKIGKAKARTAFLAAVKRGVHPGVICRGLAVQVAGLSEREVQFIPHPTTWMHREGWNDDPEALGHVGQSSSWSAVLNDDSLWSRGVSIPTEDDPPTLRSNPWT